MTEPAAYLEGRFDFPVPIYFKPECSGLAVPLRIRDHSGVVRLPLIATGAAGGDFAAPPPEWAPDEDEDEAAWGLVGPDRHFQARACYVRLELVAVGDLPYEGQEGVVHLVRWWWETAKDWVEVLTGQDLYAYERPWPERGNDRYGSFYVVEPGVDRRPVPYNEGIWIHQWPVESSLSTRYWEMAVDAGARAAPPPKELLVWRDAQAAQARGDLRRSVMDAGLAAELALERRIRRKLRPSNEAQVLDELLRATRGLGRKVALARKIGLALPQEVQKKLVEPRNRAVHVGQTPDFVAAVVAVAAAREIVSQHEAWGAPQPS